MPPRPRVKIGSVEGNPCKSRATSRIISCDKDRIQMPLPQQQGPFPRQPLRQPHPIQTRPPQLRAAQPHPHLPYPAQQQVPQSHSLVPRPNRYRCVGITWKTQSETRGRAWQKMQKKVYDSTKK